MFASIHKLMIVAPLFLFGSVGFAQTSNVMGDILGTDGKPLVGGQIKLDRTDIKASYTVKTDKKGHFLYANLPTGIYDFTLLVDGKEMTKTTGMRLKPGDNDPFKLDLSKQAAPAGGGERCERGGMLTSIQDGQEAPGQRHAQPAAPSAEAVS